MSPGSLERLFAAYAAVLVLLFAGVRAWASLAEIPADAAVVVESHWRSGERVGRRVRVHGEGTGTAPDDAYLVEERIVGRGPLAKSGLLFALGLVPGRDGIEAELDGRIAYATVDDLLRAQAYDRGSSFLDPSLGLGTQRAVALHLLATDLGATVRDVEDRARFARVRFERRVVREPHGRPPPAPAPRVTRDDLTPELVTHAVREAAHYLARNVDDDGKYRYLVDAPTNVSLPGYNWPRHAGATFFLAQAGARLDDPFVRYAALRAAARLRDDVMVTCGAERCITDWEQADVGSNALTLVAFTELVRTGADASYRPAVRALASFLRSQQRPDGELMHIYDRAAGKPLDVQYLYFSGEAALALARAHAVTGDARDLDAASKALRHLARESWSFFGSRYYWSEEHWTCQAADELWTRAPDRDAVAFCSRWHAYQRALQQREGDAPFDADGAFGVGPLVSPRLTPAASRGEAAGATLDLLRKAGADADEVRLLEDELARAVAFLVRHQLDGARAPFHLFAAPDHVRGAMPGSPVDLQLRIDYAQHAGSAMIRWLELHDAAP